VELPPAKHTHHLPPRRGIGLVWWLQVYCLQ
jgi:hypothetical protein